MRGSSEWKMGRGWLRVVTVTDKCEDPLGIGSLSGHCAGAEA